MLLYSGGVVSVINLCGTDVLCVCVCMCMSSVMEPVIMFVSSRIEEWRDFGFGRFRAEVSSVSVSA